MKKKIVYFNKTGLTLSVKTWWAAYFTQTSGLLETSFIDLVTAMFFYQCPPGAKLHQD